MSDVRAARCLDPRFSPPVVIAIRFEAPEPMTGEDYDRVKTRVHASWNGDVVIPKVDVQMLLAEIRWLKRRLRRVEHVIEPLMEALRLDDQAT